MRRILPNLENSTGKSDNRAHPGDMQQSEEDMEMMEHYYQLLALLQVAHLSPFHKEQIC